MSAHIEPVIESASDDLLKVDYADQRSFQEQRLRDKFRAQLPVILLLTALVQWLVAVIGYRILGFPALLVNSIVIAAAANFFSLLSYRKLRLFPGSRRLSYLLPAFFLPWAVALVVLLAFRLPYSITFVLVGAACGIGFSWLASAMTRRANSAPLCVIPSHKTDALIAELSGLEYRVCSDPADLDEIGSPIIADLHAQFDDRWERALAKAAMNGATIYHVKQISESLTGRVRIDHLSENSFGTLRPSTFYFWAKNVTDRCAALILFVLLAPVIAAAMIAIKLDSPGPAIFKQKRIGFRMFPFTVYKLRTMRATEAGISARDAAVTQINDARITKVGAFLRGTRIDELPQLWNVIRGDLSLIGPRPEAEALSQWYAERIEFYPYRHVVKPGITGWAQVTQGHVASDDAVTRKLQYDFYYIKNFSLWLDLLIVLKTLMVVLSRAGSK